MVKRLLNNYYSTILVNINYYYLNYSKGMCGIFALCKIADQLFNRTADFLGYITSLCKLNKCEISLGSTDKDF